MQSRFAERASFANSAVACAESAGNTVCRSGKMVSSIAAVEVAKLLVTPRDYRSLQVIKATHKRLLQTLIPTNKIIAKKGF